MKAFIIEDMVQQISKERDKVFKGKTDEPDSSRNDNKP
jgi:hypothetical protein